MCFLPLQKEDSIPFGTKLQPAIELKKDDIYLLLKCKGFFAIQAAMGMTNDRPKWDIMLFSLGFCLQSQFSCSQCGHQIKESWLHLPVAIFNFSYTGCLTKTTPELRWAYCNSYKLGFCDLFWRGNNLAMPTPISNSDTFHLKHLCSFLHLLFETLPIGSV